LKVERTLSDLANQAQGLISSEKMWQPIAGLGLARTPKGVLKK
jgi:hypothetical protein